MSDTQPIPIEESIKDILPLFYERKGFRELVWCPYLNEPCILTYRHEKGKESVTICINCDGEGREWLEESHPFIGSIKKTYESRTDVVDKFLDLIQTHTRLAKENELEFAIFATGKMSRKDAYDFIVSRYNELKSKEGEL